MTPDLTVVIPTKGRPSLVDTLASIPDLDWVEIVVVADGAEALETVRPWCGRARLFETGPSATGHPQRTLGMEQALGGWLAFMDDDDLYTSVAFPAFREAIDRGRRLPHLFRMTYEGRDYTLWGRDEVALSNVSTQMILVPNEPDRLGRWVPMRTGDFFFIEETVKRFGGVVWEEAVVAVIRDFGDKT